MSNSATAERPATAKLIAPRGDAIKHLRTACDRGGEIKAGRIRNGDELDAARGRKLEWVQDCTDLLSGSFDNTSVADYFNDFVGKVFPEYAEFGNFVEQFYEEMDHRLNKLRAVLKRVEEAGDNSGATPGGSSGAGVSGSGLAAAAAATVQQPPPDVAPVRQPKHKGPQQPHASPASSSSHSSSPTESVMPASSKVLFVSHGPKDPSSEAVLGFMQQLSLPVVEADHTNGLIETLDGRNDMGFVVVMNAADHVENGKATLSDSSMFKLGYCAGRLGLKRMVMMHGPTHPAVGESQGIAHLGVDPNGGWQLHLARQMKRAGCDVDLNRLA